MNKPVDFDELYPGRFLKAGLLDGKPTYEITSVDLEELEGDTGLKTKGIVSFRGEKMQLPLNKTNGICLREMFGRSIPDWVGKRITLFAGEYSGDPCIRIWGSPDIEKDMKIIVALPRKKPMAMTMHATGKAPAAPPKAKQEWSESARGLLTRMGDAKTLDALTAVADALAEDNTLSPEETQRLLAALTKRKAQLNA